MKRLLFYLPSLHRAIAPADVPGAVLFFPSGLPEEKTVVADGSEEILHSEILAAVKNALPLKAKEASFILGEMLGMGDVCAGGGFLRQLYANQAFMAGRSKEKGAPGEFADLAFFAATGDVPDKALPPSAAGIRQWSAGASQQDGLPPAVLQALADCQKVLLLVWWREEKLLEVAGLERRFLVAEQGLNAALADDAGGAATGQEPPAAAPEDSGVPWRVVMDAALPFLPGEAAVFTADEAMAFDLRDAGMLGPLPEDSAGMFSGWPQELVSGLLHAELPAWRLLGRKGPLDERPWLERTIEIFVARPRRGWAEGGQILKVNG